MVLGLSFGFVAIADSRPCAFCRPSMAASYFLLLAQKKVTKENGTLGYAPLAERAVRYGWTGSAHGPSMARCPNRRDPSRRPRAGHAAFPSTLRRCSEGTRRAKRKKEKKPTCRIYPVSHISGASAAGTAALCSSGFPLGRGEGAKEKARQGRAHDARAFAVGTRMCRQRTSAAPSRSRRARCPATAAARVPFSLVTFSWASKRK